MQINNQDLADLGFVLTELLINDPTPKTNFISLPAGNGSLDLSESLGSVKFNDRTLEAAFAVKDYFINNYSAFMQENHGKRVKISVEDSHYFSGRLRVKHLSRIGGSGKFGIEATCDPYRYKIEETTVQITSTSSEQIVILENEGMETMPTILTTHEIMIVFGASSFVFNEGTHKLPFNLKKGSNEIRVTGESDITFTYQEGLL